MNARSLSFTLSPELQAFLKCIDENLDLRTIHREFLELKMPYRMRASVYGQDEDNPSKEASVFLKMGVLGCCVEANISLRHKSDSSRLAVRTLHFDREEGESAYVIDNAELSPDDVLLLIAYLAPTFAPNSFNISASE